MSRLLNELEERVADASGSGQPKVSVFMSCFNAGCFLRASVESVLSQTYKNFEFVIVNDGSTDDSQRYLDSIEDSRVRIIHRSNQGIGRPLNEAMKSCRGDYVMRLDSDDICEPQRIQKQLLALESNPELILVGCYYWCFSDKGKTGVSRLPIEHRNIVGGMLKGWHTISHATIMFRRDLLNCIEGYEITGAGEDWSLILDAACHGKLGMVPEPLYRARIHEGSAAWQGAKKVWQGFEFARRRYRRYMKNQPELSIEEFLRDWEDSGFLSKLRIRLKAMSSISHRQAKLDMMSRRRVSAIVRTVFASAIDPGKAVGALWKRFVTAGRV